MKSSELKELFSNHMPEVDYCSFRYDQKISKTIGVRSDKPYPYSETASAGVMVSICNNGGFGYASTADMSAEGIRNAVQKAKHWADYTRGKMVEGMDNIKMPNHRGKYKSPIIKPYSNSTIPELFDNMMEISSILKRGLKVIDWYSEIACIDTHRLHFSNNGSDTEQEISYMIPSFGLTVSDGHETVLRTSNGDYSLQTGLEFLPQIKILAEQLNDEAYQLLSAPNCPAENLDLLLDGDQMLLQIHESIGHPIELDRILGDERNYAGTSFVTLDMFGKFQYGSELLNIVFDPTESGQLASYNFDDEGEKAEKTYIIRDGVFLNNEPTNGKSPRIGHLLTISRSLS